MHTWCAFVGRLSPLQRPVSRNSCLNISTGEKLWPQSTKSSFGPTRARHRLPPVPPCQLCQCPPPHLSPSEHRLPDISWQDFLGEAGKTPRTRQDFGPEGGQLFIKITLLTRKKTSSSCDQHEHQTCPRVPNENLRNSFQIKRNSEKADSLLYSMNFLHTW